MAHGTLSIVPGEGRRRSSSTEFVHALPLPPLLLLLLLAAALCPFSFAAAPAVCARGPGSSSNRAGGGRRVRRAVASSSECAVACRGRRFYDWDGHTSSCFCNQNYTQGWARTSSEIVQGYVPACPSESGPTPPPPAPPAVQEDGHLHVSCESSGSVPGPRGRLLTNYVCHVCNGNGLPVDQVSLTCPSDYTPIVKAGILDSCVIPGAIPALQCAVFSYLSSSGPSLFLPKAHRLLNATATVAPSLVSGLELSCGNPTVVAANEGGQHLAFQFTCSLQNTSVRKAKGISLSCSNFSPLAYWNIRPDCSIPDSIDPGEALEIGFTSAEAAVTLQVKSVRAGLSLRQ